MPDPVITITTAVAGCNLTTDVPDVAVAFTRMVAGQMSPEALLALAHQMWGMSDQTAVVAVANAVLHCVGLLT